MNVKPEHEIYTENFETKEGCIKYINKKIKLLENDLKELRSIALKDMGNTYNSKALAKTEEELENIYEGYRTTINKMEELRGELR